ncbi:MAG: hypothetical protein P8M34_01855 [Saprospiraceae bacterium]|nr:hypothetical protein [Saprospiraceae bacterium]|tara:strand:- start:828 stop:1277 length:450 start_codon:yes stop_codon:yes gene_type:complete
MSNEITEEIKGTILEQIDKKLLNQEVPESYFEKTEKEVFGRIELDEKRVKAISIPRLMWLGIAASVSILLGFLVCMQNSESNNNIFQNADNEMLIQYASLDMDLTDLTYEELVGESEFSDFANIDDEALDAYIEDHTDITELEEILEYL